MTWQSACCEAAWLCRLTETSSTCLKHASGRFGSSPCHTASRSAFMLRSFLDAASVLEKLELDPDSSPQDLYDWFGKFEGA